MAAIRHAKVSTRNPTADSTAVQPADWNADHVIAADLDVATHKIINVVDPTLPQDAATKQYVDTHGGGGGGISGLTTNTIPKATSSTSIGNGSITDAAGTVDINASAIVESNLTVQGTSTLVDTVTVGNGLSVTGAASVTGDLTLSGARPLVIGTARRIPAVSISAATTGIVNVETVVASMSIPANTLVAGMTFTFDAAASVAGTPGTAGVIQIRLGTTTLTGAIINSVSRAEVSTGPAFRFWRGIMVIRSVGATGSAIGDLRWEGFDGGGYALTSTSSSISTPVTINTTVANVLELTANSGIATASYTFQRATIAQVF